MLIQTEIMKTRVLATMLGLGLVMTGFAQSSPKPPKGRPGAAKPVASPKAKPPKVESLRPASGPTIVRAKPKPSQLVAALDANKDGKLSFKEVEAAVAILKKLDKNKDGQLTLNEFGPVAEPAKQSRGSLGKPGGAKPSVSARPSGRPSARPGGRPSTRLSRNSNSSTKRGAGARNTSPQKATRPSGRPSRLVTKKKPGAPAQTGARGATGDAGAATGKPKRTVRTAPARKKSKSASRRRPTVKPADSQQVVKLKALVEEAKSLTQKVKQAMGGIKNPQKSRAAAIWVSKDSEELLSSLKEELKKGAGIDVNSNIFSNAEKKLADVKKLLE
jgi:hypothetical protein